MRIYKGGGPLAGKLDLICFLCICVIKMHETVPHRGADVHVVIF